MTIRPAILISRVMLNLPLTSVIVQARGGGGTQIWFRRVCAAEAAKPIPIFKGHFGGKGSLLLRVFSQEK